MIPEYVFILPYKPKRFVMINFHIDTIVLNDIINNIMIIRDNTRPVSFDRIGFGTCIHYPFSLASIIGRHLTWSSVDGDNQTNAVRYAHLIFLLFMSKYLSQ